MNATTSEYSRKLLLAVLLGLFGLPGTTMAQSETSAPDPALAPFANLSPESPSPRHHQRAEILFRLGKYPESVADYETATRAGEPHDEDSCWELGLAHYYAGDFAKGAAQFARYHEVGPSDVENGLWHFLCLAKAEGVEKARAAMVKYTRMREAPFPALWALYRGEGNVEAVHESIANAPPRETSRFYAHYYVGKFHEANGDTEKALEEIRRALQEPLPYFMDACAREDLKRLENKTP